MASGKWTEDRNVKDPSIYVELIRPGRLKLQQNEINAEQKSTGQCKEACDNITGIVVISRKCWLIHTCDNNFPKVILCRACSLS